MCCQADNTSTSVFLRSNEFVVVVYGVANQDAGCDLASIARNINGRLSKQTDQVALPLTGMDGYEDWQIESELQARL